MDSTFVSDFKNLYAPALDLVIKIILGVFVAIWLARRGFKYRIKERLYDAYLELVTYMGSANEMQKEYLKLQITKHLLAKDIIENPLWVPRFEELKDYYKKQHHDEKLEEHVNGIYKRLETIGLYLSDKRYTNEIFEKFWKVNLFYFGSVPNETLQDAMDHLYRSNKDFIHHFLATIDPDRATVAQINIVLAKVYNLIVSQIQSEFIKADKDYSPDFLLAYVKGKVSSF